MKKKITFLITAAVMLLAMMASTATAWGQTTETLNIANYASANNWTNQTQYLTASVGDVTFTATGGGNTGKYYTTDDTWRFYANETAKLTISVPSNATLSSVKPTFTVKDSGTLLYNSATISSGSSVNVDGTSVEFTISQSSGNKGKVFFTSIEVTYTSGGGSSPSISADNVEITYDTDADEIEYEINNAVTGGELTANTTSDWLTLGTVGSTSIPFTCTINSAAAARTATVTLTYTYTAKETVTKNVTVTQAGNPDVVNNISDITAAGTYTVRGTIVAKSQRGFIVGDGTGYVYYYNTSYSQSDYNIGDKVKLAGSVVAYGGVFEFNASTTVTSSETSGYVAEDPTVLSGGDMDSRVGSTAAALSSYVQYVGTLSVSGTYYNITGIDGASTAQGSISYPLSTDFTSLNGKQVTVTGYYVGVSSSKYYNTMIGSIEEVTSDVATPTFSPEAGTFEDPQDVTITCETSGASIYYTTNGDTPDNTCTLYTEPISVTETTTIKAIAYAGSSTSAVATATYTIVQALTTMDDIFAAATTAGGTATPVVITCNNWVVTGVKNNNAYVTDGTKGFIIYQSSHGFAVGDVLNGTVSCNVQLYKGASEITSLTATTSGLTVTTGGTVTPVTNISIADLSGVNTGAVFSYGNLTYNGTNLVDENNNSIKPYSTFYSYSFQTDHVYNVTGVYIQYDSTKELAPRSAADIEEVVGEPSITLAQYEYDINVDGGDNELTVTYTNMPADPQAEVIFYESNGETVTTYGWITATINTNGNIDGHIDVNDGAARTAYFKVKGIDANNNDVYSNLVTINQAAASGPSIVFNTASLDIVAGGENRTMSFDYTGLGTNPEFSVNFYSATGEPTTCSWITATITAEKKVNLIVAENTGAARTAYFKVYGENGGVNALSNIVTINQAAGSTPPTSGWVLTNLADLTVDDIFVIVGDNGDTYALPNDNGTGSAPSAVAVTVSNGTLSGEPDDNIKWNLSGNATDGYTFYPNGSTNTWLYCNTTAASGSNNNIRVGTGDRKVFELDSNGYLVTNDDNVDRYLSIYVNSGTAQDWRGYINSNSAPTIAFYKKVEDPSAPSITASNVNIAYDATEGVIEYTINNPVAGASFEAVPTHGGDRFDIGTIGANTIPFTCPVNTEATEQTATIELRYTYNRTTITKEVTITQAGNPEVVSNISDITAEGDYTVQGTIVAISNRGFILGDGTGYAYYYEGSGFAPNDYTIGDKKKMVGTVSSYNHVYQFPDGTTITDVTTSNYDNTPAVQVLDAAGMSAYNNDLHLSDYVQFEGTLVKSGNYYNVQVADLSTDASISFPTDAQAATLDALENKTVVVKGYFAGVSSGHFGVVLESAEEISTESITVSPNEINVDASEHDGTLTIAVSNMTITDPNADLAIEFYDGNGTTITKPDWVDFDDFDESGENFSVYYIIAENDGAYRQAFFKVFAMGGSDFVYSNLVTINQEAPVAPGTTGTITFGNAEGSTNINSANVTGTDSMGNTWTITTEGTSSFTPNAAYAQVGSSSKPASSITFTTTLPSSATITAFEAKFGGFSNTAGDIALIVDETTVGTGALNGTEDVVVSNTTTATGTTLTVTVTNIAKGVKCYYISYTISTGSDPIIIAQNSINLSSTDTYGEFGYEVINAVSGTNLSATTTDSWISNINVTAEKVTFTTTPNTSATDDREGTITLSYEGATNKTVSVIQSKVDYAALPFAFDGGRADIETTIGLTQEGLDSDYNTSPKLKFNTTGDWMILKLNAAPASLSYDIKGNGFSNGTFDVEISVDGVTYTNIAQYTSFGSDVQPVTHIILDDNTRYVRWIYTEKSGGNVALGNIHASANYDIYGTLNIDSFDATMHPTRVHEKGIINAPGMVMSSQDDLVIEDGGQVITNVEFMATLQKNISGYGDDPTVANGWYLISSPVANLSTSAVTIDTYDLFAYEEAAAYWWSNTGSHSFDALQQGIGYLYANSANQTLNFAGTMVGTNTAVEKAMTAECTYDNLKGYNLMGNPFTCNLENGDIMIGATAITSVLVAEGGDDYVTVNLNDDGAVKPGQGFMVQTAAPATLTLNPGSSKGANSGFVRIVAGNENATDKAYINVANGNTLRKINLSDNSTKVYVMNDGKDYAAARVEELAGTMPVHFKAAEDGEYTITIEAVNADVEYMHLIDNFTGNDIDLLLESSYTFNATTNDSEARFRLDFGTYGVNEIAENNTFAYQYGNEIVVNGEGELQIFDLMGRMIMNTKINGVQSVNVPSNSVYILKLNNNIQKIVVK